MPINYNVVQPRNESRNNSIGSNSVGGGGGGGGGLSRSPSLLAQFSNSWGSRSTSPTPSYFSNSLRRVSSNTSNNLLMPNQSIQNLYLEAHKPISKIILIKSVLHRSHRDYLVSIAIIFLGLG
ncbi:hypothetical protein QR98_0037570 [Sarcoptes scabiei]|uniref:Uncharacterized protein n=1 Tax=Sarcoptes scabiei TaxID=52283 RepID=A0A132A2N5_SARSC|nr:hypothetical protein QR98_0037570 [Sarcoptes scabiei]